MQKDFKTKPKPSHSAFFPELICKVGTLDRTFRQEVSANQPFLKGNREAFLGTYYPLH